MIKGVLGGRKIHFWSITSEINCWTESNKGTLDFHILPVKSLCEFLVDGLTLADAIRSNEGFTSFEYFVKMYGFATFNNL